MITAIVSGGVAIPPQPTGAPAVPSPFDVLLGSAIAVPETVLPDCLGSCERDALGTCTARPTSLLALISFRPASPAETSRRVELPDLAGVDGDDTQDNDEGNAVEAAVPLAPLLGLPLTVPPESLGLREPDTLIDAGAAPELLTHTEVPSQPALVAPQPDRAAADDIAGLRPATAESLLGLREPRTHTAAAPRHEPLTDTEEVEPDAAPAQDSTIATLAQPAHGASAPATSTPALSSAREGAGVEGLGRTDAVRYLREVGPSRELQRLAIDLDGARVAVRIDSATVRVDVVDDPAQRLGGTWVHDVERTLTHVMSAEHSEQSPQQEAEQRRQPRHQDHRDDAPDRRTTERWTAAANLFASAADVF